MRNRRRKNGREHEEKENMEIYRRKSTWVCLEYDLVRFSSQGKKGRIFFFLNGIKNTELVNCNRNRCFHYVEDEPNKFQNIELETCRGEIWSRNS